MAKRVAEVIVDFLVAAGAKHVYGIAGDSLNALTEVFRRRKDIGWVHTRHEEAAAFAAGSEAQLTGRLGVCAGSCGPGNLHLINGLYDASRSRVPVVAIASQIPSAEIGTNYFQETHPEYLFKECSVYCGVINTPRQVNGVMSIAIQSALGECGVSVVVVPGDVAWADADEPRIPDFSAVPPKPTPSERDLTRMAELLNSAEKVTILAGAGCAGAHDELVALAGKLKAPVVHTARSKELVEYDNPYDVGMTGLLGVPSGYYAMMDSDVVVLLGTDFPYRPFYPSQARIIQVDLRREQIGRRVSVDVGVVGDVGKTLRSLLPLIEEKKKDEHLKKSVGHYAKVREKLDASAQGEGGKKPIRPQYLIKLVDRLASDDAVFTCDVGTPTLWAARYLSMNGKRRLIGSFSHGSMANALAQAVGAQVSYPNRQVVSLSGDGGLSMLMGELLTLAQYELPVKVVVFNNGSLAYVELEMKAEGLLPYGTELKNPDFAKLAQSIGISAVRVEDPAELESALKAMFEAKGPSLIDVVVNRYELVAPPKLTLKELSGFGLYMIKALLNNRGDEVIDLAKTSLFDTVF
ncbi:MAG: ubiquinone-dependent pyruvate dehydrogenase [Thermoprotei archaeon]